MMTDYPSLAEAEARDTADPLASWRDRFTLPEGVIYLDGNSLGALPVATRAVMHDAVDRQWGKGLIRSWNDADWIGAPRRIGDKIAALIGAAPGEVIACDSVTVNLYKLMGAILAARSGQGRTILTESGNFPTDLHVAAGIAAQHGLVLDAASRDSIVEKIGPDVALNAVFLDNGYNAPFSINGSINSGKLGGLLELRIRMQPALELCNRLPPPRAHAEFRKAKPAQCGAPLAETAAAARALLGALLALQSASDGAAAVEDGLEQLEELALHRPAGGDGVNVGRPLRQRNVQHDAAVLEDNSERAVHLADAIVARRELVAPRLVAVDAGAPPRR